jgi:hypothetical protein
MKGTLLALVFLAAAACTPPVPPVKEIPLHCVFVGTSPPATFDQPALVSVVAPAVVGVGETFSITFRAVLPSLSPAAVSVYDLTFANTYVTSGPATPSGARTFNQAPVDVASGDTVPFTTFSAPFTATGPGTVVVQFTDLDYEFAYSSGGSRLVSDCTPTSIDVTVATVTVVG